ncbi:MAG: ABC transporter permease subunit [Dehalococcoidales bacterium]|nr:ABC transporter permease subunit [Dehalococcoidales bacterium]
MAEFPEWLTIPLADWVGDFMGWVLSTGDAFFGTVGQLLLSGIYGVLAEAYDIQLFVWLIPGTWWAFSILALVTLLVLIAGVVLWRLTHRWAIVTIATAILAFILFGFLFGLLGVERLLLLLPWFIIVLLIGFAAWRAMRRWWAGILVAASMVLIGSFRYGDVGYWDLCMETLALMVTSVMIALAIGIPTGILMSRSDRMESIIKPQLDAMQTMPSFVYLVPAMMLFSLGPVPAVFATVLYATPPVIRLTNIGIRQVSPSAIEAARAFGSSARQILFDVQLPLAVPSIMVGINQTTMMALAMVVIASMVAAGGLGDEVLRALQGIDVGRGFQAGLSIVLLAIIIDRITGALASRRKSTVNM